MNPTMSTAKQQVESLLNKLPENCSLEDTQYHLYVLDKVRHGLEDAKQQGTLSQDDVKKRMSQWLTEYSGRHGPSPMSKRLPLISPWIP